MVLNDIFKNIDKYNFNNILDVGCGLGRTLVVAAKYGYRGLFGLDISDKLIAQCNKNLRGQTGVNLTVCDAFDYNLPNIDLVVFLFNPFGEDRINSFIQRIIKNKKDVLVVYHNPVHQPKILEKYLVDTLVWNHFGMYQEKCNIYHINY